MALRGCSRSYELAEFEVGLLDLAFRGGEAEYGALFPEEIEVGFVLPFTPEVDGVVGLVARAVLGLYMQQGLLFSPLRDLT